MVSLQAFTIQPAASEHATPIRNLILHSGINPTGLHWERFIVVLTHSGDFIGCGQIKPHSDATMELASIAVVPEWRGRGVARLIIETLLAKEPGELYLMCQSSLGPLYERFGFQPIQEPEMPTYFRRVSKLAGLVANLAQANEHLLVMRRLPTPNG